MEFPSLGEHCQNETCNQIDFLPLQCKCGMMFCRLHFNSHCYSGDCELAPNPREYNLKILDKIYRCAGKGCKIGNLHEMLCNNCNKHYCVFHRFHPSCPEIDDETMLMRQQEYESPKRQFHEANKNLQDKITANIRKALQSSAKVKTASKIHLMRLKQKSVGPKSIPVSDRIYFAIKKPANMDAKPIEIVQDLNGMINLESFILDPDLKDTISVFISSKWSLGRAIDSICDSCNIKNDNNKIGCVKLRIFRQIDGYCISPLKMDIEVYDLIKTDILVEGDKLVVDYIDSELLSSFDNSTQVFLKL